HESGVTAGEVAASIGAGLAKAALAAHVAVDGGASEWYDLNRPIDHDARVAIITPDSDDGREVLRHSTAHVMAQAVSDLFPGAKYAIGPAIADGFYYDFELPDGQHFSDDDLERIEARMREIVRADEPFVREELARISSTSAAARRCRPPSASVRSSSPRSRAPTGGAPRSARCSSGSTA